MADTLALAYQWMLGRLNGSSTMTSLAAGRYYRKLAPEGATLPAVTYNVLSWRDLNDVNGHRCSARAIVVIQAITAGRALADLRPIMTELDALFHNVKNASSDGALWTSLRIEQLDTLDVVNGKEYTILGGRFELWATRILPVDLAANLAHHWPLTTDGADTVGSLDLVSHGAVTITSEGAVIDGVAGAYLQTPETFALGSQRSVTVACWVKVTAWTGGTSPMGWFNADYSQGVFWFNFGGSGLQAIWWPLDYADQGEVDILPFPTTDAWHLLVAYIDVHAATVGASIDGAAPVTESYAGGVYEGVVNIWVGSDNEAPDQLHGSVANVRVYLDRVPDQAMLDALYMEGHAP